LPDHMAGNRNFEHVFLTIFMEMQCV